MPAVARRRGLGAEEQQILRQALRDFSPLRAVGAFADAQLRQQARGDTLGVIVRLQQPLRLGFEEGAGHLPQRGQPALGAATGLHLCAGRQAGKQVAQGRRRLAVGPAHQGQGLRLDFTAQRRIGVVRGDIGIDRDLAPLPVVQPQVGRVDAVSAGQFLHGAVLGEQGQRRHRLVGQQAGQVVEQRERGLLDRVGGGRVERHRAPAELLQRGLVGPQHLRRCGQAHQFECADPLVQLCARRAQHTRVDRIDVRAGQGLGLLQVTADGLVRRFQRPSQFVVDPRQGAQVVDLLGVVRRIHRRQPRSGFLWDGTNKVSARAVMRS